MRKTALYLSYSCVLESLHNRNTSPGRILMKAGSLSLTVPIVIQTLMWPMTTGVPYSFPTIGALKAASAKDHPATYNGGALPGGIGWYRKTFTLPCHWMLTMARKYKLNSMASTATAEVWINGHYLGKRAHGYISFQYDLTPYLHVASASSRI